MSAWYVFSALGFYPVTPGQPYYAIGSPTFKNATINLENGKQFKIIANGQSWTSENIYVQSATLNGRPYNITYLHHKDIVNGGVLELVMGPTPSNWGVEKTAWPRQNPSKNLLVPVPYFSTSKNTFKDTLQVRAATLCADCEIYMSTPSKNPHAFSGWIYNNKTVIAEDQLIGAFAKTKDGRYSDTIWTTFYKINDKLKLTLKSEYANQYAAGGDDALIDRQYGTSDFRTGSWQGYQGQDVEFVLAFGELRTNPKVTIGFLQDVRSWVWFPPEVQFYFSADGKNWSEPIAISHTKPDTDENSQTLKISAKAAQKAAFVKVVAKNYGVCPPWHLGAGGKSWLFLDEVEVK
jgi:hypothetical protein